MTKRASARCLPTYLFFYLPVMEGTSSCKVSVGFRTFFHFQISLFNLDKTGLKTIVPFDFLQQPRVLRNNSFEKWPLKAEIGTTQKGRRVLQNTLQGHRERKAKLFLQQEERLSCSVAPLMSIQK